MRAEIIRDVMVAWDGVHVESMATGVILEGERAAHAVEQGFARDLSDEKAYQPPKDKAVHGAPKNKGR